MNTYRVTWTEQYAVIVTAINQQNARREAAMLRIRDKPALLSSSYQSTASITVTQLPDSLRIVEPCPS